jgi:rubrerythrin
MNSSIKRVKGYYVIHFLQMLTQAQKYMEGGYIQAQANAKPFGGSKMHTKDFGGGIKFDYQIDAEKALAWAEGKEIHTCEACGMKQVESKDILCPACTNKKAEGTFHGEPCHSDTF